MRSWAAARLTNGRPPSTAILLVLPVLVFLVAAAVRLPRLQDIPRITDETAEVADAVAIAFEGDRPLVAGDSYRGPAWAYLLATLLRVIGPEPWLPRIFALVLSALAAAGAYLLGREVAGVPAGLAAGLATATAFGLVALGGHVAWSNNSTVLWVLMAAWCLQRGLSGSRRPGEAFRLGDAAISHDERGTIFSRPSAGFARSSAGSGSRSRSGGRSAVGEQVAALAAAALLWGVALHSHPSAIAPFAGAAVWAGLKARRASPLALGLGSLLFLLTLSPVLWHNVVSPLDSVTAATAEDQPVPRELSVRGYGARLVDMAGQIGRTAGSGPLKEPGDPTIGAATVVADTIRPIATVFFACIVIGGLGLALLRGPRLVGLMGAASLLILPLVNHAFTGFYDTRYVAFIVPLGYIGLFAQMSRSGAPRITDRRLDTRLLVDTRSTGSDSTDTTSTETTLADLASGAAALAAARTDPVTLGRGRSWGRRPGHLSAAPARTLGSRMAWLLVALLAIGYPLLALTAYYEREEAAGRTNVALRSTVDDLALAYAAQTNIFIDKDLRELGFGGGGNAARAASHLLGLKAVEHDTIGIDELRWYLTEDHATKYVILASARTAEALANQFDVEVESGPEWSVVIRAPESETSGASPPGD